MSYFNYKSGKPIAIIKGGINNGKIIYIGEKGKKCCLKCNKKCGITKRKCCINCKNSLGGCFDCSDSDSDSDKDNKFNNLEKIFKKELNKIKNSESDHIKIKDGKLIPIPRCENDQVGHLMVCGTTGSGKSTYIAMYVRQYLKLFPKNKVYLFSGKDYDKAFDEKSNEGEKAIKPKRLKLDERLYEDPIDIKAFKNSIVIFDDIEKIKDKHILKAISELRDEILANGRSIDITVVTVSHNPTKGKETKDSMMESQCIVFFPGGGDDYHLKRVLKEYCSINPKKIKEIMETNSRHVLINKHFPKYCMTENEIFFAK